MMDRYTHPLDGSVARAAKPLQTWLDAERAEGAVTNRVGQTWDERANSPAFLSVPERCGVGPQFSRPP